jgi:hypothetical protein
MEQQYNDLLFYMLQLKVQHLINVLYKAKYFLDKLHIFLNLKQYLFDQLQDLELDVFFDLFFVHYNK